MENVPLHELKKNLAYWAEKAAQGEVIQITKYNRPFVVLTKSQTTGLYIGKRVGKPFAKSGLKNATKGKFLEYLLEDREDPK
jgi:antitoxin (DNA-binding transcriptional repressor) of toxin-antitoxin stability system